MKIRTRLTFRFAAIVASILVLFSIVVYALSAKYRSEEFYSRLEERATTTARGFFSGKVADEEDIDYVDNTSIYTPENEVILIYNSTDSLLFSSRDIESTTGMEQVREEVKKNGMVKKSVNTSETVGKSFTNQSGNYILISSAFDRYGRSKLDNLRNVLIIGVVIGLILIFFIGRIFAGQVLDPIAQLNDEIRTITAGNLNQRIPKSKNNDELSQLGINFNEMLERLESAFSIQQQIVSSASHELRTPLAVISGQLQTALDKPRSEEEYRSIFQSVFDEGKKLTLLTNGLLTLAQSGIDRQRSFFEPVRVDEVLFSAQDELSKANPDYQFKIDFENFSDDESTLTVMGSEQMLRTVFLNLMDNACKYSKEQTVYIKFGFKKDGV